MWSGLRLAREERRRHPRSASTRRPVAVRARRALRPQARRDRAVGAGHRRPERRDADRARPRVRLRPAARARAVRERRTSTGWRRTRGSRRSVASAAPEGRGDRARSERRTRFDPYATLEALEGRRVRYVLIGGFARVVQGTEELTRGLDLAPVAPRREPPPPRARPRRPRGDARRRQADRPRRDDHPRRACDRAPQPRRASSRSSPSRPAPAAATTTSAAPPAANRSAEASAPPSPRSATSPAWLAALGREQDLDPLRQLRILADSSAAASAARAVAPQRPRRTRPRVSVQESALPIASETQMHYRVRH